MEQQCVVLDGQLNKAVTGGKKQQHCSFWKREHPNIFSASFLNYHGKNHEWALNLTGKF